MLKYYIAAAIVALSGCADSISEQQGVESSALGEGGEQFAPANNTQETYVIQQNSTAEEQTAIQYNDNSTTKFYLDFNKLSVWGPANVTWGDGTSSQVRSFQARYFLPGHYIATIDSQPYNFSIREQTLTVTSFTLRENPSCQDFDNVEHERGLDESLRYFQLLPAARNRTITFSLNDESVELRAVSPGGIRVSLDSTTVRSNQTTPIPDWWQAISVASCNSVSGSVSIAGVPWPRPLIWRESAPIKTKELSTSIECKGWTSYGSIAGHQQGIPIPHQETVFTAYIDPLEVQNHPVRLHLANETTFARATLGLDGQLIETWDSRGTDIEILVPEKIDFFSLQACSVTGLPTTMGIEILPYTIDEVKEIGPIQAFWQDE